MDLELVPLCEVTATLAEPIVLKARFQQPLRLRGSSTPGWRIRATMAGSAGGDWLLVGADGTGALDVRITLLTDDGALVHVRYDGRADSTPERDPRTSMSHSASRRGTNSTLAEPLQGIGKGAVEGSLLRYAWFEMQVSRGAGHRERD